MSGWQFGGWPPPAPAEGGGVVTFAAVKAALAVADSDISVNGQKIVALAAGTDPTDAVNLGQIGALGFVVGPATSTDTAVARFDLATGKLLKNSTLLVSNAGAVSGAVSYNALPLNASAKQVAIGTGAVNFGVSTGDDNLGVGHGTLAALTTGSRNVAIGLADTAFALGAPGQVMTTGFAHTLVGDGAGAAITTASGCVAIGNTALSALATGSGSTAVGSAAMRSSTVAGSTAVGSSALRDMTTGAANVALGFQAGQGVTTGSNNTLLGRLTGGSIDTESGNILIGLSADLPANGVDSQLNIGGLVFGDLAGIKVRIGGSGALAAQTAKLRVLNAGADTVAVLSLASTGTNGAEVAVRAGTQDPNGAVSGNAGDVYVRKNGATSGIYVNQSAADPGSTWTLLL